MRKLVLALLSAARSSLKSRRELALENLALRQQLAVLRRHAKRPKVSRADRAFWVVLARVWPEWRMALAIVQPATVIRWHRKGFALYWSWKSRKWGGRPRTDAEIRTLIREMARDNVGWGAPRIHGELLKLGFEVAQSTVAKYMVRPRGLPSQGWKTFLRNHAPDMGAIDMFVVPTIGFRLLYGLVIIKLDRRHLVWINVTANPTAEWVARQITEAFPCDHAPQYLIRDRDASYGRALTRRLAAMGIRDRPTAPRSP